jgi:hypothetical protein
MKSFLLSLILPICALGQSLPLPGPINVPGQGGGGGGGTAPATVVLAGTAPTISWVNKGGYSLTLTGATTLTFSGVTDNTGILVTLSNSSTNSYTATFTAPGGFTLEWVGATPVMSNGSGGRTDKYFFQCTGTIIYGSAQQGYSP